MLLGHSQYMAESTEQQHKIPQPPAKMDTKFPEDIFKDLMPKGP